MQITFTPIDQPPRPGRRLSGSRRSLVGLALGAALLGTLTGCIGYVEGPSHSRVAPGPGLYVDDYVYYPGYQVYYGLNRRQYLYQEGRTWVTRPAPPRVSVNVLLASPSVRLDFHDAPSAHHATVVRQYPKHWRPADSNHNRREGNERSGR